MSRYSALIVKIGIQIANGINLNTQKAQESYRGILEWYCETHSAAALEAIEYGRNKLSLCRAFSATSRDVRPGQEAVWRGLLTAMEACALEIVAFHPPEYAWGGAPKTKSWMSSIYGI